MQHIRYRCTDSAAEFPDRRCSAGSEPSAEENALHASSAFPLLFAASHRSIFLAGLRWRDSAHRQSSVLQLTARYDLPVSKYDFAALQEENETTFAESLSSVDADAENITEALSELVKNNAEAADFVADYPNRQNYLGQSIDLTHDVIIGQVPLFLQWDKRWGYVSFGDSIIGLSGCGPTCLSMAYVYFTRDLNGTPREMASYCEKTDIIQNPVPAGPCGPMACRLWVCPAKNYP